MAFLSEYLYSPQQHHIWNHTCKSSLKEDQFRKTCSQLIISVSAPTTIHLSVAYLYSEHARQAEASVLLLLSQQV